jgi:hypothetical protein
MKSKIETAANVFVIIVAMVVGSIYLKDRFFSSPAQPNVVKAGDKLTSLEGWDWAEHDQTLVLVLRKGCHFCEDSAPFYHTLSTQAFKSAIVAVFPDPADSVKEITQSEGLNVTTLAGMPLEKLNIPGTPALLLVDRNGRVLNVWWGALTLRQEVEVMTAMQRSITN